MKRAHVLRSGAAAVAAIVAGSASPSSAAARSGFALSGPTLDSLLAAMPAFMPGAWLEYSFEDAPKYAKRIGFGIEHTSLGTFRTIETQVGGSVTDCDPDTVKKAYLSAPVYGNLLQPHDVRYLTLKAGPSFLLAEATKDDTLWLLDTDTLYASRPATIVADSNETVVVQKRRIAARRVKLTFGGSSLRTMTMWLAPKVPGGIARLEAVSGEDAFAIRLHAHGAGYATLVTESFDTLRNQLTAGAGLGGAS